MRHKVRFYVGTWHVETFKTEAAMWAFLRRCMSKGIAAARVMP